MFKLVIQDDEGKTTVVPLIRDEITIGRKEGNTIRLTERNVSRRHARILRNNGEVQIEDLGSYNGIRVNNARIAERVALRVSDQVQIGDYKLYLKAEGIEQVDDARTMPIERVDGAATDVMTAVNPAPTQPMQVPATPAAPTNGAATLNRSLVGVADTDPQGRPVATAAAVAALTSPVGYGKLVVLSSNFAGKEFELSRPQMIVGRTDENDIVVNHRSISRNHAKLVRETDTGRYTISDLQSSNGVRVNGQDYGKVELRRGDVIDLGHVRLRFVEAGEDFVFARDAVITDVPDAGGKRTLLLVALVGLVAVGAVVAFLYMRSNDTPKQGAVDDPIVQVTGDAAAAAAEPDADAVAALPAPDDAASAAVESVDAQTSAVTPNTSDVAYQCKRSHSEQNWTELRNCVDRLRALDAPKAKEYQTIADNEIRSQPRIEQFKIAMNDRNLKRARAELDGVWDGSVYYQKLKDSYDKAEAGAVATLVGQLRAKQRDCAAYNLLLKNEAEAKGKRVADEARRQVKCVTADPTPPPPTCTAAEAEEMAERGRNDYQEGRWVAALAAFESALRCKPDAQWIQRSFMAACQAKNVAKAAVYYKRMSTTAREQAKSICIRVGIEEADLLN